MSQHSAPTTTATDAPRPLGELAAAIAAIQHAGLLRGDREPLGRELRVSTDPWRMLETRLVREPDCRGSHTRWEIEPADPALTLAGVLARADAGPDARLRAFGTEWIGMLRCRICGEETAVWRTAAAMLASPARCSRCTAPLEANHFELRSALPLAALPEAVAGRTLRELGFRMRDVISIESAGAERHFELSTTETARGESDGTVVLTGLGNVGSACAPLVACTPGVRCLVLVDHDRYEARNLGHQAITPDAVGQAKVTYQAERLRALRPDLDVVPIDRRLEEVPLGIYRDAAVIACLDSRLARLELSERASRVARFLIDVGIDGPSGQARVHCFGSGADETCLLCLWNDTDFEQLEQVTACDAARGSAPQEETTGWTQPSPAF